MREKLGKYIKEYSVRNKANEDIPVYSVTNTQGFCQDYFGKEVASKDKSTYKIVPRGCFAYNPSRINVGSIDWQRNEDRVIVSPLYNVFSTSELLDQQYLYYFLKSDIALQMIRSAATGSVRDNLKFSMLCEFSTNIPALEMQKGIVRILDKVKTLIDFRQQELQKLDDLVKARFVEMFGTLDNPARQFEYFTLKELCSKITDGKHGGCIQESGTQRYFVGAREIYDDEVHYDTAPEISIADFEKDYKRCNLEIGDFLIVNTGATIGKSAIASDYRTEKTLLQKSVALLKVKREVLDPVFLKWCYRVNANMYMVESASAQPNLLLSKINSTKIYVPEIELQSQFSSFVQQVDKSKFVVQQALDKAQLLFDSLMQQYFG